MGVVLAIIIKPMLGGWAVCLTDGRQLARFRGPGARLRAERFAARYPSSLHAGLPPR
jgi:hypothetical protein